MADVIYEPSLSPTLVILYDFAQFSKTFFSNFGFCINLDTYISEG